MKNTLERVIIGGMALGALVAFGVGIAVVALTFNILGAVYFVLFGAMFLILAYVIGDGLIGRR